jgi:hypothetical protein
VNPVFGFFEAYDSPGIRLDRKDGEGEEAKGAIRERPCWIRSSIASACIDGQELAALIAVDPD